jgi:hypothetical protein
MPSSLNLNGRVTFVTAGNCHQLSTQDSFSRLLISWWMFAEYFIWHYLTIWKDTLIFRVLSPKFKIFNNSSECISDTCVNCYKTTAWLADDVTTVDSPYGCTADWEFPNSWSSTQSCPRSQIQACFHVLTPSVRQMKNQYNFTSKFSWWHLLIISIRREGRFCD